jgi:type VI secretion system protein ImpC
LAEPQTPTPEPGSPEEIRAFAREVVRPHLVKDDSDIKTKVAAVDEAISRVMSAFIHTSSFQRLEAIWRSVVFLLSRLDATGKVRVYLVHLPKGRLERDLAQGASSAPEHLRDLFRSPRLGVPGRRWSMVVGAYDLAFTAPDIDLLAEMAPLAREADVPLITSLGLPGDDDAVPREGEEDPGLRWEALRESPSASWLGVTYPRFLLREPFGRGTKRVKPFHFQEETPSRDTFLWGSGAFVAATLLAQSLVENHRAPGADFGLELLGMPHGPLQEGSEEPPSSLEVSLTPDDVRTFLGIGVMPLFTLSGRASVRLGGLQSVMEPPGPLSAWWKK